jgi:hypothetical protein
MNLLVNFFKLLSIFLSLKFFYKSLVPTLGEVSALLRCLCHMVLSSPSLERRSLRARLASASRSLLAASSSCIHKYFPNRLHKEQAEQNIFRHLIQMFQSTLSNRGFWEVTFCKSSEDRIIGEKDFTYEEFFWLPCPGIPQTFEEVFNSVNIQIHGSEKYTPKSEVAEFS